LHTFIYGIKSEEIDFNQEDDELLIDTQRFDVNPKRLEIYQQNKMKKLLKKKFVNSGLTTYILIYCFFCHYIQC
jgi:hypothetical protein